MYRYPAMSHKPFEPFQSFYMPPNLYTDSPILIFKARPTVLFIRTFEGKFFKSGLVALQCVIPEASTLTFDLWGDVTRYGLLGDFTVVQTWNNHAHT